MSPSKEYLERCASQTGYQVGSLEKVVRLGGLAHDIGRQPLLSETLALKGGTALNLGFGPPKRLSIDLDFNYVGSVDRDQMLKDRPEIEKAVLGIAARAGYRVQASADAFAGRKIYLQYQSVLGMPDRIEVDLNYLFRLPLRRMGRRELWQPGELDRPKINMVSLEEILVGKLLAFFDRCAARDLWDLTNLPATARAVVQAVSFRPLIIAMSATLEHPIYTYSRDRLDQTVTDRAIKEQLLPVLIAGDNPRREDLVDTSWSLAGEFSTLKPNEIEYVAGVERGELLLHLLSDGLGQEISSLADHPALLWKISNVHAYLARAKRPT